MLDHSPRQQPDLSGFKGVLREVGVPAFPESSFAIKRGLSCSGLETISHQRKQFSLEARKETIINATAAVVVVVVAAGVVVVVAAAAVVVVVVAVAAVVVGVVVVVAVAAVVVGVTNFW